MSKYIDADKLKTWLENEADMEFKKTEENANSPVLCHFHNGCRMQALDTIDFIDSLQQEQPEVDLDALVNEAFDKYSSIDGYGQLVVSFNRAELYSFIKKIIRKEE
jgi:hypothetical protein